MDWMHGGGHLWTPAEPPMASPPLPVFWAISLSWYHTHFLRAVLPCLPSKPRSVSPPLLPGKLEFTFLSLRDTVFGTQINSHMKHTFFFAHWTHLKCELYLWEYEGTNSQKCLILQNRSAGSWFGNKAYCYTEVPKEKNELKIMI